MAINYNFYRHVGLFGWYSDENMGLMSFEPQFNSWQQRKRFPFSSDQTDSGAYYPAAYLMDN
jgi:hypothetical protein